MADTNVNVDSIELNLPSISLGEGPGFVNQIKGFFDNTRDQLLSKDVDVVAGLMGSVILLAVGVYLWRRL